MKGIRRAAALFLAALFLLPLVSGCAGETAAPAPTEEETRTLPAHAGHVTGEIPPAVVEVREENRRVPLEEIPLNTDLAHLSRRGDLLKIDAITPSLDTCSMEIFLYDLSQGAVLCSARLSDGSWATGLTREGFYAAEVRTKELYLFDRNGKTLFRKTFSGEGSWSPAAAVNAEGDTFAVFCAADQAIHFHSLADGGETALSPGAPFREILSYQDGRMTLLGLERETYVCLPATGEWKTLSGDPRCSAHGARYSLGATEQSFIVSSEGRVQYLPFASVDEWVAGVGETSFATTVQIEDGTLARLYDLAEKKTYALLFRERNVEEILPGDGEVFALAGSPMDRRHTILRAALPEPGKDPLVLSDTDRQEPELPRITPPAALPGSGARIVPVPVIPQFPEFPTGCESVSTVMVLRWAGKEIGVGEFVDEYLPKSQDFDCRDGVKYGPDPYEVFIGSPRSAASYGCMAPVIEKALRAYLGETAPIKNTTGSSLDELCAAYIDRGIPVLVWATINMLPVIRTNSWTLPDGTLFTWPGNEHCLVLVGYDSDRYYFNDPYSGKLVAFEKGLAQDRYAAQGQQSLVLEKPGS